MVATAPVPPSPNCQSYSRLSPWFGSEEPEPSKEIAWPATPVAGADTTATGGWFGGGGAVMTTDACAVAVPPLPSVTVSVAGWVPGGAYVWVGTVPLVASP